MDIANQDGPKNYEFGGRLLYNLVRNENSAVYSGFGVGYVSKSVDPDVVRFNLPVGFEFSFDKLPEIGFSAETGLIYDYTRGTEASNLSTVGGNIGGSLGLGIHYYF